jgi:hypothetical protein
MKGERLRYTWVGLFAISWALNSWEQRTHGAELHLATDADLRCGLAVSEVVHETRNVG